jgi:predicted dehydrogenase
MRFGLVGTGPWAGIAHGPGLAAAEGVDLVGVWGRDPEKARDLAGRLGVTAFEDLDTLYDEVEAVAFAVPPEVQGELALRAAERGRHLLLDKPIAATVDAASRLVDAVEAAGVASVVFFTDRYTATTRDWLAEVERAAREVGPWQGGWGRWLSPVWVEDTPFGASPWRREHGALRDIGPHLFSYLTATLGPVTSLTALPGAADVTHLVVTHESGATSSGLVTHSASEAAQDFELAVWGPAGVLRVPGRGGEDNEVEAMTVAARELVAAAESGTPHPLDVRYGARIVELVVEAERQVSAARAAHRGSPSASLQ